MLGWQRISIEAIGDQHVIAQRVFQDQDRTKAIAPAGPEMSGDKGRLEHLVEVAQQKALPAQIASAPPGDAVEVSHDLSTRQT